MEINADRKGPKDIRMLAAKKSAFESLAKSSLHLQEAERSGVPAMVDLAQKKHDDNFEYLMELHDNDHGALMDTANTLRERMAKGKGN